MTKLKIKKDDEEITLVDEKDIENALDNKVSIDDNISADKIDYTRELTTDDDLDDLIITGRYYADGGTMTSLTNAEIIYSSIIEVIQYNTTMVSQRVYTLSTSNTNNKIYYRVKHTNWSNWNQIDNGYDYTCTAGGTGYMELFQIKLKGNYPSMPVTFDIYQKQKNVYHCSLLFTNTTQANVSISNFVYTGAHEQEIYAYKIADYTWNILIKKTEQSDLIRVTNINTGFQYMGNKIEISRINDVLSDKPSSNLTQATYLGFTSTEKTKLAGIAIGATNNIVTDNLVTDSSTNALSANQGKVLKDLVDGHNHDSTYIKKTGGVSQHSNGNIIIPSTSNTTDNDATGKIPFAGHLISSTYNIEDFTTKLKSFMGGLKDKDNRWWNVISARMTNGGGSEAENNGLIFKSVLDLDSNLLWNKQRNGTWGTEKTILDSSNYSTYASPKTHTHTKLASNGSITDGESLLIDYTNEGVYTVGSTTAGAIQDTPYTGNYSCLIENKYYATGSFIQFCYKMPGSNPTEIYYRKKVGDTLTGWRRIGIKEDEPEYVTSTHASGTNAWTGTCANIVKLEKGTQIFYKLNQNPTTDKVTLNLTLRSDTEDVVTTGAKNVYTGGSRLTNQFNRYNVIHMVYDGNNWLVLNGEPKTVTATITYADGSTGTINFVTR